MLSQLLEIRNSNSSYKHFIFGILIMSKKVFVGGLSWDTDEQSLENTFGSFGQIEELKLIRDRETGRSRGFAFVTFENSNEASEAIEQMNGSELDGRRLKVNEAEDRPRNSRGSGGGFQSRNRY